MNPDKLFDYLDGKLSPADRDELENKLIDDPQLQQQFAIAREIHRSGRTSREIKVDATDAAVAERGRRLGGRVAGAVAALVLLNVLGGLAAITYFSKRPAPRRADDSGPAAVRRQMEQSLRNAGTSALPDPSLAEDQISLAAVKSEWSNLAEKIVEAAEACDGSAVAGQPSESSLLVTAQLPRARAAEFREKLLGNGSPNRNAASGDGGDGGAKFETIEIRIAEAAR